jgi:hypothetical protein
VYNPLVPSLPDILKG